MNDFEQQRRNLLFGVGVAALSQVFPEHALGADATEHPGTVLAAGEGENLIHFRDHGMISIKASARTGSDKFALGTQQVMLGSGIPVHRHLQMDEAFYILDGSGVCILDDARHSFEKGAAIFIPRNSWHGFENPDHELLLLWIVSPAGLDGFFRETCNPPGVPPRQFTRDQVKAIALKYATEFR
jgi:quercetin dioxygenase-like cupin family protein